MRLLSEGLPFLVVVIGFEKSILLTQSVLSHALKHPKSEGSANMVQYSIEAAMKENGFGIVRDYVVEILILVAGAFSGIQGGLQQFCFLAAWILFFDCILLFLFYVPILCIKLEMDRIRRHIEIRNALEDDGISRRVAENVAQSNEPGTTTIFGWQIKNIRNVPKFKTVIVGCFVLVNIMNLVCTIPLRTTNSASSSLSTWSRSLGSADSTLSPVDPLKFASNGLDTLLDTAKSTGKETVVTVLTPIKYELEYPSVHHDSSPSNGDDDGENGYVFHRLGKHGLGSGMVGSLLKSLEDPVLHKWFIVALSLSITLNGYLFNAARWGIKDHITDDPKSFDPKELARAERLNNSRETAPLPRGESGCQTLPLPPGPPFTPVQTDDEADSLIRPTSRQRQAQRTSSVRELPTVRRTEKEMEKMLQDKRAYELSDEEIVSLSLRGKIAGHALEKTLNFDFNRAVKVRRTIISRTKVTADISHLLERSKLPYENYDWAQVFGACCENVIGYMPLPLGLAGPLVIDGKSYFIPMATTEGVLVASASRGAKAINAGGGAVTVITSDGMTRGPCVSFESLERAGFAKSWLDSEEGQTTMKKAFNSTSRFARLESMKSALAGTTLFIRFKTTTGDAMGMNMISKGVEHALNVMRDTGFEDMNIITLTGNYCTDKKPSAINWIEGRGKSVVAEAIIPSHVVKSVLKTDVDSLVDVFIYKNMIGSAMSGSIGGFNAQAANLVAAIFIATGQDPAQVVESANCITIMKNVHGSLQISVSMPSIEVGTLGGGTILDPQGAMLDLLGVRGPHPTQPGENARRLSRIIAAATMAGELSLCSALAAGHLVKAHMQHNRSAAPTRSNTPAPSFGPGPTAQV